MCVQAQVERKAETTTTYELMDYRRWLCIQSVNAFSLCLVVMERWLGIKRLKDGHPMSSRLCTRRLMSFRVYDPSRSWRSNIF